jgi:hypothetical protein
MSSDEAIHSGLKEGRSILASKDLENLKTVDEEEDSFSFNLPEETAGNYVPYRQGKMDDTNNEEKRLDAYRCLASQRKSLEESKKISRNGSSSLIEAPCLESCDALALKSCEDNPP